MIRSTDAVLEDGGPTRFDSWCLGDDGRFVHSTAIHRSHISACWTLYVLDALVARFFTGLKH